MATTIYSIIHALASLVYPIPSIFIGLLLGLILRAYRLGKLLIIFTLIYFYLCANGLVPKLLLIPFKPYYKAFDANIIYKSKNIIMLGGGTNNALAVRTLNPDTMARALTAYRIYSLAKQHGLQDTIYVSGITEAKPATKLLLDLGVPSNNIITEANSINTFENAKYLNPLLKQHQVKTAILVTSALHMQRSQKYFNAFGYQTFAAASDYPAAVIGLLPIAHNLDLMKKVLHEYLGLWGMHTTTSLLST